MIETISILPLFVVLTSLIAALFIFFTNKSENLREFWTFSAAAIKLWLLFKMVKWVLAGNVYTYTICQILPNLSLSFRVDGFGLFFALIAGILWVITTIYSIGYMRPLKEHAQTRYFTCFALALSATMGVAFSSNLLTLYLFYEMLSVSTYALVGHHQDGDARTGSRKYLTYLFATSIGLVLPAMVITYTLTGTLEFSAAGVYGPHIQFGVLVMLLLMFVFGFAKAGLMPFHSWLPGAMVAPTPVSGLLHAVAVVKVGVFSVVRVLTGIFGISLLSTTMLSTIVCVIASFTVITASLIALSQDNLKRRLAFSTIGQLAYIILGAGLASTLGVAGSVMHIGMHAFGKITLFFCAGAIYVATGKKYISQMKGLGRRMPITMTAFFIGALSVIGLPPLCGFASKWFLVLGAMSAGKMWVLIVYLISSLLNAAYFLPIVYHAFFSESEDGKSSIKEAPIAAVLPLTITAFGCFILFFYHRTLFDFAMATLGA